jgi:TetR/AcrR family transcriptional regulator, acrAB operon repressor
MARKTKEDAQETRHAILDAAEQVFQKHGVSRTSLAQIAEAAGMTRGAIYWHFKNKAALFDAMIERVFDPLEAKMAEAMAQGVEDPLRSQRDLAVYFIERVAAEPQYLRILEISWHKCEYVGEMATSRDNHLECGNRYLSLLENAMRLAIERGYLSPKVEPRRAAVGVMAVIDGLVVNWTLDHQLFPLAEYGTAAIDTYFAGLRATV